MINTASRTTDIPRFLQVAPVLLSNGYSPVPIEPGTKSPNIPLWTTVDDERTWRLQYAGYFTGIRTGRNGIVAVDIDVLDENLAKKLRECALDIFGDTPLERVGRAPKTLLVYQSDGSITFKDTYRSADKTVFEVLTFGQQFVAFARHSGTGRPYEWPRKSPLEIPGTELPLISAAHVAGFENEVAKLVPRDTPVPRAKSRVAATGAQPASISGSDGKLQDGRNEAGTRIRAAAYTQLREASDAVDLDSFTRLSWDEFCAQCETGRTAHSDNVYAFDDWARICASDLPRLQQKFPGQLIPGVKPWYDAELLEPEEAQRRLRSTVRSYLEKRRNTVIRVTAGIGKTTVVAEEIARHVQEHDEVVHFLTPRLELARAFEQMIRVADPDLKVVVIEGRAEGNCQRMSEVKAAHAKGIPISSTLCGRHLEGDGEQPGTMGSGSAAGSLLTDLKCRYFDKCSYQSRYEACRDADVVIFAHAHLATKRDSRIPAPDLIVVDEAFHDQLIRVESIPVADIQSSSSWYGGVILEALRQQSVPPKKFLLGRRITADALREEIKRIRYEWQVQLESYRRVAGCNGMGDKIGSIPVRPKVLLLLEAMAIEFELKRPEIYSVALRKSEGAGALEQVLIRTRAQTHRLTVPTLILDATADRRILEIFLGDDFEFHDIAVARGGTITQVSNVAMNKTKLLSASGRPYRLKAQRVIDRLATEGKKGVIFTYKDAESLFTIPEGWVIDHFGNLRGANAYKEFETAVIIGRWALPPQVIGDRVAGLVHATELTPDMSGKRIEEKRGYRMRDGSHVGRVIKVYTDPLWQAFEEQYREAELEQALDRLRLVWGGQGKQAFVVTNQVARFEIDHLRTLDDLAEWSKFELGHEAVGPVLPLGTKWLSTHVKHIFGASTATKAAVATEIARIESEREKKGSESGIKYSIPVSGPFPNSSTARAVLIPYRVAGQRGSNTQAHVLEGTPLAMVESELARLHGAAVRLILGENVAPLGTAADSAPEEDDAQDVA